MACSWRLVPVFFKSEASWVDNLRSPVNTSSDTWLEYHQALSFILKIMNCFKLPSPSPALESNAEVVFSIVGSVLGAAVYVRTHYVFCSAFCCSDLI